VWPRRTWPVLLVMVAFVALNVVFIFMIGRTAERFPGTDAAGMATLSRIVYDGCFFVFFVIAVGSRVRRITTTQASPQPGQRRSLRRLHPDARRSPG
jgi:hypothetical protein